MSRFKDVTGEVFGRLTAVVPTLQRNRGSVVWKCKCICGNIISVSRLCLVNGDTQSCGCIRKDLLKSGVIRRTHGGRRTPLYWIWSTMKSRCLNPRNQKYLRYGGRGITVCPEWMDFENFRRDMGNEYKKGLQIDRIDNNSGYSKPNCRWTTSKINNNNRYY